MTTKKPRRLCIDTNDEFEIDLKRLCFRFHLDNEKNAIKSAVHMLATMNIADFYQFLNAYQDRVIQDNKPTLQRNRKDSKIEKAGGVDLLIVYKMLGYTQTETAKELNCRQEELSRWLKRRGLSWKDLK